jgi:hypothetical protein
VWNVGVETLDIAFVIEDPSDKEIFGISLLCPECDLALVWIVRVFLAGWKTEKTPVSSGDGGFGVIEGAFAGKDQRLGLGLEK